MTRKWTYILAALLMGLIGVIVLAAVHIPAQQRQLVAERQTHAEMLEVALRVLPANLDASSLEAVFAEVDGLPVEVDDKQLRSDSLTALELEMVVDEARQAVMRQDILEDLSGVTGDFGYLNQGGREYLVQAAAGQSGLTVTVFQVESK